MIQFIPLIMGWLGRSPARRCRLDRDLEMALEPGSTDRLLELKLRGARPHDVKVLEKAKNAWMAQVQVGGHVER